VNRVDRFVPVGVSDPPLLLNPGPINVSARVAEALLKGDLCHREPEFAELQSAIRGQLLEAFAPGDGYTSVLLTGSGTAALEAAVSSIIGPDQTLLVCQNGVYGERIRKIAQAHQIEHRTLEAPWTERIDPAALREVLASDPSIGVVACVHHETTTGLLNPIEELAAVCREAGRAFLIDAISAIAGEELDLAGWGVDACVGTANKCIRGLPGISFVLLRRELMARIEEYPPRTLYLHLPTYHGKQETQGTPFTPAVQVAFALREALGELLEEGVGERVARMAHVAELLRKGFVRLGLELLLEPRLLSNTITTLGLPEGWTYDRLHDALRVEGFVIYAGQGDLRRRAFRVSNMGVMDDADYLRFLEALERVLEQGATP
jgi:2-aminoethylphosphonate-pyruvate transaminase